METYAGLRPEDLNAPSSEGTALADADVDAAIASASAGDVRAVLDHLTRAARHSIGAYGRSAALRTVHPELAIREAAGEAQERFDGWQASVFARRDLFAALDGLDGSSLAAADRRHLDLWKATGRINGAHLDRAARDELKASRERATQLSIEISERFVAEAPIMELTPEELEGLPAQLLDSLEPGTAPGTRRLRVEFASRDEVLTGIRRRDVRERYWWLLGERSAATNREPMRELYEVRRRIARLAGFASWAELRTSTARCGPSTRRRPRSTRSTAPHDRPPRRFSRPVRRRWATGRRGRIRPWDQFVAVAELGRGLGVDRESLRRFLPLEGVLDGLFRLAREVFGIRVEERPDALGWNDDVRTLALIEESTGMSSGCACSTPMRATARTRAPTRTWMSSRPTDRRTDGLQPPAVTMLVTMFEAGPGSTGPAVRQRRRRAVPRVRARAGLHDRLAEVARLRRRLVGDRLGGRPVAVHGLLGTAPDVLATFARDPETGESIAAQAVQALAAMQGLENLPFLERYLSLGRLDLAVHGPDAVDLDEAWQRAWAPNPLPQPADHFQPFNMIMVVGGYDAALYGVRTRWSSGTRSSTPSPARDGATRRPAGATSARCLRRAVRAAGRAAGGVPRPRADHRAAARRHRGALEVARAASEPASAG